MLSSYLLSQRICFIGISTTLFILIAFQGVCLTKEAKFDKYDGKSSSPWYAFVQGGVSGQSKTDTKKDGSFSVTRAFFEMGIGYSPDPKKDFSLHRLWKL